MIPCECFTRLSTTGLTLVGHGKLTALLVKCVDNLSDPKAYLSGEWIMLEFKQYQYLKHLYLKVSLSSEFTFCCCF